MELNLRPWTSKLKRGIGMWRYPLGPMACMIAPVSSATIAGPTIPTEEYAIVDRISGPSSVAAWDYAVIDAHARRLFLATISSSGGCVTMLNLSSGRVTSNFVTDKRPHGI